MPVIPPKKSAPAKPAPAPAKPPAKPSAPPAKPAPAAPKPPAPPAKSAAPTPPAKPTPAAVKPAAPPTPKAAPAAAGVSAADFEEFQKLVEATLTTMDRRLTQLELVASGYSAFVDFDENGNMVMDLDKADRPTLRNWVYQFGLGNHDLPTEKLRKVLKDHRAAGKEFVVVQEGQAPAETTAEPAASEEGEGGIDEAAINAMNWAQLVELCKEHNIPYADIKPPNPKLLRARVIEAAAAQSEEAPAAEADLFDSMADDTIVEVTDPEDGSTFYATYKGLDADGDPQFEGYEGSPQEGQTFAIPRADAVNVVSVYVGEES
jgi:hypothetical protein